MLRYVYWLVAEDLTVVQGIISIMSGTGKILLAEDKDREECGILICGYNFMIDL